MTDVRAALDAAMEGGPERHRKKVAQQEEAAGPRALARLLDPDSLAEGLLANWEQEGLGADGVVTGMGTVGGRPIALMANDPAVKAARGPEDGGEILRIQGGRSPTRFRSCT